MAVVVGFCEEGQRFQAYNSLAEEGEDL